MWVDHRNGIEPGMSDWEEAIRTAIISSSATLFVMSPRSLSSSICKAECQLAHELDMPFYLARLEECDPKTVWLMIKMAQYADFSKDFDAGIANLVRVFRQKFPEKTPESPRNSVLAQAPVTPESPVFSLDTVNREAGVEANATAQLINGKFVVFEGSTAHLRAEGTSQELKQRLIEQGILVKTGSLYRFTKNVDFNTSSAAGSVIRGQNTNGPASWRVKGQDKVTFQMWQDEKLKGNK